MEDEKKKAVDAAMGVSPQNQVEPTGETTGDTDYYANLKNESYKAMLDAEIQADVAKQQSMKYVGNTVAGQGLAGQGMAESSRVGILNTFNQALSEAQNTHNKNLVDIGAQEVAAQKQTANDNFESMTTLMSNASDVEGLNNILKNYKIDVADGVLSGEGYDALDSNSQAQLNSLYQLYSSQYQDQNGVYTDLARLQNATVIGTNGKPLNLGTQFNEETQIAFAHALQGDLAVGTVVCLDNTKKKEGGTKGYIMWTGKGFKVVNEDAYNKAISKNTAQWISGKESKWF